MDGIIICRLGHGLFVSSGSQLVAWSLNTEQGRVLVLCVCFHHLDGFTSHLFFSCSTLYVVLILQLTRAAQVFDGHV